jgi:hypothetical protein
MADLDVDCDLFDDELANETCQAAISCGQTFTATLEPTDTYLFGRSILMELCGGLARRCAACVGVARRLTPAAMRRVAAIVVMLFRAATVLAVEEDTFTGHGPIPVRNFQPIQLIFLNLPVERARVLERRAFALHLETAESNEIATDQGDVDALLKFETNRTVLGGKVGVAHGLELGLDVPFISRFGGFLDPFVDSVEDLFGTSNPERTLFPNNSFGGFFVRRGNEPLFTGRKQQLELSDLWVSAKYELWDEPGLPLIAVRGAIKAPTGRAGSVFGSGKPDFGFGVAAEHQFLDWLIAYGNLGMVYPVGPITRARLTLNPMLIEGVAAEARLSRHLSFVLQQETYTSPIHGTGARLLEGVVVELTAGVNLACDPLLFQLGVIDNLSPVVAAADFTVLLRMTYRHLQGARRTQAAARRTAAGRSP